MEFRSRLIIFLTTFELIWGGMCGNWLITVFKPIEEISFSCSLSESIFEHNVSTIISTWNSLVLVTRGTRLDTKFNFVKFDFNVYFILPFYSQILNLTIFVFEQFQKSFDNLSKKKTKSLF